MNDTKYEIEVRNDEVIFWEWIPLDHLSKLIYCFESMGYDEAYIGYENSTLRLVKSKKNIEEENG